MILPRDFIEKVRKRMHEERLEFAEALINGGAKTLDEYREEVGRIAGMQAAENALIDEWNKYRNPEGDDE